MSVIKNCQETTTLTDSITRQKVNIYSAIFSGVLRIFVEKGYEKV